MLCKKPFLGGLVPFGCGQCLPCRLNKRRTWTHRIMLESMFHAQNSFITLTYDDDHLPVGGSLVPSDLQKFFKRLAYFADRPIRRFAVGEYGDASWRPHYHAAVFGLGFGPEEVAIVQRAWPFGNSMVGDLTPDSAQYIAGYVTKKLTAEGDPRLQGRYPEFARMSLKPGIGAFASSVVSDYLTTDHGVDLLSETGDVPLALQHGGRSMPLGRYLRKRIKDDLDFKQDLPPSPRLAAEIQKMRDLRESILSDPSLSEETLDTLLAKMNRQKIRNLEARIKIHKKGRFL